MPAKSKKQLKFMQAVAHNKDFAKKVGVPQSVGKEFTKVKKYKDGGDIEKEIEKRMKESGAQKVKPKTKTVKTPGGRDFTYETNKDIEAADAAVEAAQKKYFKKGGAVKKGADGCAVRGKTKGKFC